MAVVLSCNGIAKSHGARRLFRNLSLGVDEGERLGIIGPNGSGKTTLLEILAGVQQPDDGERALRKLARLGYVPQDSIFPPGGTPRQILAEALSGQPLDAAERDVRISVALGRAGLEREDIPVAALSGGGRKRLAIAAELVKQPDVLLLDEPTNHLDLDAIEWLEQLLTAEKFAVVFVSHDRYFLENVALSIAEINRVYPDGLFRAAGSYSVFLGKREEFLEAQSKRQQTLANQVRREIEWLRRGPKARTGKSRARIDSAGRMIEELDALESRSRTAGMGIDFTASGRRTKRLVTVRGAAKSLGGKPLFGDLSFVLSPGTRLGVVGPNGSGKTTLLEAILGETALDEGEILRAEGLRAVRLDQHRASLDLAASLRRALAPEGDSVIFRGRPMHVAAWAKRFLFTEEQLALPVESLSGGERARVSIARLMLEEADVLALDEPTNDLDIPALQALEEQLLDFAGALVLVTHDRYLLDRVANVVVGLDGDGEAGVYADYMQWERAREERRRARSRTAGPKPKTIQAFKESKKLSYNEQREWDAMEEKILLAEAELEEALAALNNPEGLADPTVARLRHERYEAAQAEVDRLYERWAELEAKQPR